MGHFSHRQWILIFMMSMIFLHYGSYGSLLKSDLSSVDFVIVRFLMKLFNTRPANMDIINNCRQYFDVTLPSTLWSDRVRRFEKMLAKVAIFLQNFSLNSIAYIYLIVKFLFCLFSVFFHVYLLLVMVNLWKKTDRMFTKLLSETYLWTKKAVVKLRKSRDLDLP